MRTEIFRDTSFRDLTARMEAIIAVLLGQGNEIVAVTTTSTADSMTVSYYGAIFYRKAA
jgi:hypothetical protein